MRLDPDRLQMLFQSSRGFIGGKWLSKISVVQKIEGAGRPIKGRSRITWVFRNKQLHAGLVIVPSPYHLMLAAAFPISRARYFTDTESPGAFRPSRLLARSRAASA